METDDMFLQFEEDLDNIAGGSSSVGDNTGSSSQQTTPTPRRRAQSRLLELERHVAINGCIPMTIAPGAEKPISPHAIRFSQAIGVCVRKTFPVRCLKWADVGREYIERLFVIDFNDQAMNRFVEHQMLTTFKKFRADCHRHFKKYSDPEEARANPPNALVGRDEDWHFLCDHYISRAFQALVGDPSRRLAEQQVQAVRRHLVRSPHKKEIELQAKLHEALERIEVQDRNHQALASQVEAMKKMIEDLTRAQQGPPHDP
ncbi:CACTA en-spm transposon protein [Cucumis melo var. makuwa]|uniref:CACTA en-spm transposon protein n=1 Tax=Cucumis melo var. makuwa TaxID=1194695 RepID=A0A5A7US26_CUCMM|nr:CACTA en-spm transposon protein [Cucumis melo var. makuwa]